METAERRIAPQWEALAKINSVPSIFQPVVDPARIRSVITSKRGRGTLAITFFLAVLAVLELEGGGEPFGPMRPDGLQSAASAQIPIALATP